MLTVNALTCADSVLIPIQCEYYALEGVRSLIDTFGRIKRGLNPALDLEGIVLTMYDSRTNLSYQVAEQVRNHFKSKVFETAIPRNVRLGEAPSYAQPIICYDTHSAGAAAYRMLAKELIERNSGK